MFIENFMFGCDIIQSTLRASGSESSATPALVSDVQLELEPE